MKEIKSQRNPTETRLGIRDYKAFSIAKKFRLPAV